MSIVARSGEKLARLLDRRHFMKGAANTLFGVATASVLRIGFSENAYAASFGHCPYKEHSSNCNCSPTNGMYCNSLDPSYCSGYHCGGGCTKDKSDWHASGCWCTRQCSDTGSSIYYVCCDCNCGGIACTCGYAFSAAGKPVGPPEPYQMSLN